MRCRPLGKTGLEVSELALGTWGLSGDGYGAVSESDQDRVIERARAVGINLFETADSYAHGHMESRLGRLLSGDASAHLVTKVGSVRDGSIPRKRFDTESIRRAVDRCRERTCRTTLDVVLLHHPSRAAVERGEATATLDELRASGQLRAWGVSATAADVARAAIERGADVVQIAHNLIRRRDLREIADAAAQRQVGVLVRSVLAYGLLCGHWPPDRRFPEGDHRAQRWTSAELRLRIGQLDAVRPAVGTVAPTLRAVALRYALSSTLVSSAVIGPRSTLQLDQLVRESGQLAEAEVLALEARLDAAGVEG